MLPPLLRALFIASRDPQDSPLPFSDGSVLTQEVQSLRHNHNLVPDSAIADVATVLRRRLDAAVFESCLSSLPPEARAFWNSHRR